MPPNLPKGQPNYQKKSSVVDNIQKMEKEREERRQKMEEQKLHKKQRQEMNLAQGRNVDADFDLMIESARLKPKDAR